MLIECDNVIQGISFIVFLSTAASSCTNPSFVGIPVITVALMDTTEDNVSDSWPFEIMQQNTTKQAATVRMAFSCIGCCTGIVL